MLPANLGIFQGDSGAVLAEHGIVPQLPAAVCDPQLTGHRKGVERVAGGVLPRIAPGNTTFLAASGHCERRFCFKLFEKNKNFVISKQMPLFIYLFALRMSVDQVVDRVLQTKFEQFLTVRK